MRWRLLFPGLLSLALLPSLRASPLTGGKWSAAVTYRGAYDSNLLRYSHRDRERFLDASETHLSRLATLDDWRSDFKGSLTYKFRPVPDRDTRLRAIMNYAVHADNPFKNFVWMSFYLTQEIAPQWRGTLYYFYEPRYYIREYYDIHTATRRSCEFSLSQTTARLAYRPIHLLEFEAQGRYKVYAYNRYFTEYDGHLWNGGIETVVRSGDWRFALGYWFSRFDNTGFSELDRLPPGVKLEDNEAGDADYEEDEFSVSARYAFRLTGYRARVLWEFVVDRRHYTTTRPVELDPIHAGRRDLKFSSEYSLRVSVTRRTNIELGLGYNSRDSEAPLPVAPDVKNYRRWSSWVELSSKLF